MEEKRDNLTIRERRKRLRISQKLLSERTGIPVRTIQTWETRGTYGARAGELKKVADFLGCTIESLL